MEQKDIISTLYERLDSMKNTSVQLDKEIERNTGVINVLNKATDKEKETLEIEDFVKTIQKQVDAYKVQKKNITEMIENTEKTIKIYETDKDKYADFLNTILISFGFGMSSN